MTKVSRKTSWIRFRIAPEWLLSCLLPWLLVWRPGIAKGAADPTDERPCFVVVLADDLGLGELGCTGSTRILTPRIDALRADGVLFTAAYSTGAVCAPSRAGLITGWHSGNGQIRDNTQMPDVDGHDGGQFGLAADTPTLARDLRRAGYATAAFGKWALGGPHPDHLSGHPLDQGFDRFFGFLCQRHAIQHRTHELWSDRTLVDVAGNPPDGGGPTWVPDLIVDEAVAWLESHADRPFLLYLASSLPHLPLDAPPETVSPYLALGWDDPPYLGGAGYPACEHPRATYAAMVSRFDEHVGRIVDAVERVGLASRTVVVITSDHGPPGAMGGCDPAFFASTAGLRGFKGSPYEGGLRVPLIVSGGEVGRPDEVVDVPVAQWDLRATIRDLAGLDEPVDGDGISLVPWLTGATAPTERDHLYWESPAAGGFQAVRWDRWKGVRRSARTRPDGPIEVYDLVADPAETTDLAPSRPEIARELCRRMATSRTPPIVDAWRFCP